VSDFHRTREWAAFRARMKPRLAAEIEQGQGQCINCGGFIPPGTPSTWWQVGHRVDVAKLLAAGYEHYEINTPENVGPSHSKASGRACNQIAGGAAGAASTNAKRKSKAQEEGGHFKW
jgi:hypothetical protein